MTTTVDTPAVPTDRSTHPVVATLGACVDALLGSLDEIEGWAALDTLVEVEGLIGRLSGVGARLLARVEADGLWAIGGGRSVTDWLAVSAGLPYARARDRVQLSRALRDHLPATAEAVLTGQAPLAHAQALATHAVDTEPRQRAMAGPAEACGEGFLLARATEQTADAYRRLVRRWAAATDPDADERGYRDACDREFLALSATTGGVHLVGFLTTEHGAAVGTMLDAVTTVPTPGDVRTAQQRRAAALVDASRLVLDHGLAGTGAAVRPHGPDCLVRLTPVADVERFAVGDVVGTRPIPLSVLARLACDSEISRIVFGPDSQVINVGRAERIFSGPRRRAIVARDQTCRYHPPRCQEAITR